MKRWRRPLLLLFAVMALTAYAQDQNVIVLDLAGERGVVYFNHKSHETLVNPDPDARFKAKPAAACVGCHHTTNTQGVTQLISCRACHLPEGNAKNPKSVDMVEITTDEAFHRSCIGCHRAAEKGPRLCTGCHKMVVENQ